MHQGPGNGTGKYAARKILFSSVHSILDFSNGASVATMDVLQGLTTLGFDCQAFCTAKLDLQSEVSFEKMIADLHEPYEVRASVCGDDRAQDSLYPPGPGADQLCSRGDHPAHQAGPCGDSDGPAILRGFFDVYQPDVLFTYGGDRVTVFVHQWRHRLPVATPYLIIDHGRRVHVQGNASDLSRSMRSFAERKTTMNGRP